MKIAIIDGNQQALSELADAFAAELKSLGLLQYKVETYSSGEGFFDGKSENNQYLMILSEILLPGMNGIELADKVRDHEPELPIIFLTYSNNFAMESYNVGVNGYIQKPLTEDKLIHILKIVMNMVAPIYRRIYLPDGQAIIISEIYYIKCVNHRCMIYMEEALPYTCGLSSKQVQHMLSIWDGFYQLAKGVIVNFSMVKTILSNTILLKNGHYLPIAKSMIQDVEEQYQKFTLCQQAISLSKRS